MSSGSQPEGQNSSHPPPPIEFNIGLQTLELPATVPLSIRLPELGDFPYFWMDLLEELERNAYHGHSDDPESAELFDGIHRLVKFDLWCCPQKEFIESRWGRPMRVPSSQASFYYCDRRDNEAMNIAVSVVILYFSVVSRASFQEVREASQTVFSKPKQRAMAFESEYPKSVLLLVGYQTQSRSDPETMHQMFSTPGGGPILPEEGERVAREMGAAKYMECETGNPDHLYAVLREAMRLGWNRTQERMTDTFIFRAEKWLSSKWSSFKGSDR